MDNYFRSRSIWFSIWWCIFRVSSYNLSWNISCKLEALVIECTLKLEKCMFFNRSPYVVLPHVLKVLLVERAKVPFMKHSNVNVKKYCAWNTSIPICYWVETRVLSIALYIYMGKYLDSLDNVRCLMSN